MPQEETGPITHVDLASNRKPLIGRGWLIWVILLLGFEFYRHRNVGLVLLIALVAVGFYWWIRRLAIVAVPQGLIVRNWIWSHHLGWADIDCAFAVRDSGRVQLLVKLKNGQVVIPRALQRVQEVGSINDLFTMVGVVETINHWVSQNRRGLLVELSYQPIYPADVLGLVDEIESLEEQLTAMYTSTEIEEDSEDGDSEWQWDEERQQQADGLADQRVVLQEKLKELLLDRIDDKPTRDFYPHARGSEFFYGAGGVSALVAAVAVLLVLVFGPFGRTIDARVVAHEGSEAKSLNTIVEFDPGNGMHRYEIGRIADAPPYKPVGQTVEVSYFRLFPPLVSETSGVGAESASKVALVSMLLSALMYAIGRKLRYRR